MITKIKDFFLKYLDIFLIAVVGGLAFFIGQMIRTPLKPQPGEPRNFENADHFKAWYNARFLNYWLILNGDCDDKAELIQRCALRDGFILSLALLQGGIYYSIKVSDTLKGHCGILALTEDGSFYYLEHNSGTVTFIVNRDK